jgi:hypothetical protein
MNDARAEEALGNSIDQRSGDSGEPVTEYSSKMVMLRAERHDIVQILDVHSRFRQSVDIPSEATVKKRSTPYYGPKIVLSGEDRSYLLTAPGPDSHLILWKGKYLDDGERYGWEKLAEVSAQFADDQPQYDLCPECGNPLQTLEHERKAAVGRCPGPDS